MKRKINLRRLKPKSVKLRIWEYFCVFAVCLLVAIWLLQVVFLQYYYTGEMARQTLSTARQIVTLYENDGLDESSVRSKASKNNIFIIITDKNGNVVSANDVMGEVNNTRVGRLNEYISLVGGDMQQAIADSKSNEVYYRLQSDSENKNIFFYGGYTEKGTLAGGAYIYVISPLEPIDSVISVLQRQFIIITLIAFVFSLCFAYFIAKRFSQPIEKLTKGAKEMALGNSEVRFECDDCFGEISDLSNALNYAADEIEHSAQLRRELMANVSHDLRTPLTMIKMYAEMIRDLTGDNKEKREKNLKVIIDETDRLSRLVNDILELSKIEANTKKPEMRAFDICKTVSTILERFGVMCEQGYSFELDCPDKVYVLGEEERIEQVIYNLLGNAINYTGEDKKVKIHISGKFDCARIEIIDSGDGIPKEQLAGIWDRYYRAKTHIRSTVGTGLGLSIVKSILIAHNADFGIESTLGVGSDFWFELKYPESAQNKTLRLADNTLNGENEVAEEAGEAEEAEEAGDSKNREE